MMQKGTRTRTILAVLAILLVAALIVWLASRSPTREPVVPEAGHVEHAEEAPPPVLVGRHDATPAPPALETTAPPEGAESAAAADEGAGFHLRVHVAMETPPPPAGGFVTVAARQHSKDVYLARTALDADARATIDVPEPDGKPPWQVTVRSEVPGLGRGRAWVGVDRGATVDVEITPEYEARLVARVVDGEGRPVAGLRVGVVNGGSNVFATGTLPEPDIGGAVGPWDSSLLGTAVTDDDGRFAVNGVVNGALSFLSFDERWWIEPADGRWVVPGEDVVELRARPAFRLEVLVAPADPGDDPASWSALQHTLSAVAPDRGGSRGLGTFSREAIFRGPVPDLRGFDLRLYTDTFDHRPDVRTVAFTPGAWFQQIEVSLVRIPASERGTLVIAPALRDANGEPAALTLLHTRTTGERSSTGHWVNLATRPDGSTTAVLPAGRQQIAVTATVPLKELFSWKGTVDVEAGTETDFEVPWPSTGALAVALPVDWVGQVVMITVQRRGEQPASSTWRRTAREAVVRLGPAPAATLQVVVQCGATVHRTEVTVAPGVETIADATR